MRIDRQNSRLSFRRRRRRSGCFSLAVFISMALGLIGLSRDRLEQWLSLGTDSPDLRSAEDAFIRGDLDDVIEITLQIADRDPQNTAALVLLVRALLYRSYTDYNHENDRRTALEITSEAIERLPANLDLKGMHALALQADHNAALSVRFALFVIERDPQNLPARLALALAYGQQGLFDAALRESQKALELANSSVPLWKVDALRALSIAYSDVGRYQEAVFTIENAIQQNKRLIPLQFERALYALQLGDTDAATVAYFQVIAFDGENVKARLRLCELSSSLREHEAALRYCAEVTERAPSWSDGWYYLGREYFLQGDFARAQSNLNRCTTLQTVQNVPVEDRRFECWYLQGQAAEIQGDCAGLQTTYNEFRAMSALAALPETWTYPPEGPSICLTPTPG